MKSSSLTSTEPTPALEGVQYRGPVATRRHWIGASLAIAVAVSIFALGVTGPTAQRRGGALPPPPTIAVIAGASSTPSTSPSEQLRSGDTLTPPGPATWRAITVTEVMEQRAIMESLAEPARARQPKVSPIPDTGGYVGNDGRSYRTSDGFLLPDEKNRSWWLACWQLPPRCLP